MSELTGGTPYGASTRAQGRHVAQIASKPAAK
jgi:hypothetical protein